MGSDFEAKLISLSILQLVKYIKSKVAIGVLNCVKSTS